MDLISVIVPVYNVEQYLPKCLDSIINQTYKNLEIILVDDGSTDNSGNICAEYALNDGRIKVIHKMNGGVSSARNLGIDNANGKYICFIDSDDTVGKNYIDVLANSNKEDYDLVICNIKDIYNNRISLKRAILGDLTKSFKDDYYKLVDLLRVPVVKLYKADIIKGKRLRFREDITTAEDQIFNFEYYRHVIRYKYIDLSLYNYFHRGNGSLSTHITKRAYECNVDKLKMEKKFLASFQITNSNKILNNHTISTMQQFAVLSDCNDAYKDFVRRMDELILFIDFEEKTNSIKRKICLFLLRNRLYFAFYLYVILKNANINAFRCR